MVMREGVLVFIAATGGFAPQSERDVTFRSAGGTLFVVATVTQEDAMNANAKSLKFSFMSLPW